MSSQGGHAPVSAVRCGLAVVVEPQGCELPAHPDQVPRHLGVILDGNRRWSRRHATTQRDAYARGAAKVGDLLCWCEQAGIEVVTVWALSADNLQRPPAQLEPLLRVIVDGLWRLADRRRWCLRPVGCLELLPPAAAAELCRIAEATLDHHRLLANIAVAYDGRQEITGAVRALVRQQAEQGASAEQIAAALVSRQIGEYMFTSGLPDLDLVIRTSGEQRLSGFMPWQAAYAELYFTTTCWPDFTAGDLADALAFYRTRQRRFGQ